MILLARILDFEKQSLVLGPISCVYCRFRDFSACLLRGGQIFDGDVIGLFISRSKGCGGSTEGTNDHEFLLSMPFFRLKMSDKFVEFNLDR